MMQKEDPTLIRLKYSAGQEALLRMKGIEYRIGYTCQRCNLTFRQIEGIHNHLALVSHGPLQKGNLLL